MPERFLNRRCFLSQGLSSAAVIATGVSAAAQEPGPTTLPAQPRRSLRFAHLTDIHIQPELRAAKGLAACLKHVQEQSDRPEVIFNTGDCVMDSLDQDRTRTEVQWDLWNSVWKAECSLPVEHGIGNHDIWGWNQAKSKTSGTEAHWGKAWALDALHLSNSYRSFDRGGWLIVMLDSIQPAEEGYRAQLDDAQLAWLEADLARTDLKTPVLVLSHIPILSIASFLNGKGNDPKEKMIPLPKSMMHCDYERIKALFKRSPNVKACLSGHTHLLDEVDYLGIKYLCGGAVSGDWWKGGRFDECQPGYSLIDIYDDGSVRREYVVYGWHADITREEMQRAGA